ncbi:MAG: InlB B-repeat-containing protein, partial [Oscillospiraceae bacterium]|nr:InlB B-repeat-containing protein [Oscillospiraceae bacterium]
MQAKEGASRYVSKRALALLLVSVMCLSAGPAIPGPAAAAAPEEAAIAAANQAPGTFETVADVGVDGSRTYLYTPSALNDPTPMMTPVIFVYPNTRPADEAAAEALLSNLGLIEFAEAEHAAILLATPAGTDWGDADIAVYNTLLRGIWYNNSTSGSIKKLTFFNLIYAIGEGSGATFIHNKLSQNANRVAGVATFGGDGSAMPASGVPLPAYIAGAAAAVNYYKSVNQTNRTKTVSGKIVYYNGTNDRQQVMVNPAALTAFDKDAIRDAWDSMLRYTTRAPLTTRAYDDVDTPEVFALMPRPNPAELGLVVRVKNEAANNRWYEWIPQEALEASSTEKFPLVLVLHGGGDHEVFEAESNGWVALAGRERFIVASPKTTTKDLNLALAAEMIANYPVDPSRVYVTGFSAGSSAISNTLVDDAAIQTFAAAVPFSFGYNSFKYNPDTTTARIPFMYHTMEHDINTARPVTVGEVQTYLMTVPNNFITITSAFAMNNIALPAGFDGTTETALPDSNPDSPKYARSSTNTFYRFEAYPNAVRTLTTPYGITGQSTDFYNADGVNMIRLSYWENMDHDHFTPNAQIAWDFMRQFARDPETKEIVMPEGVTVERDPDGPTGYKATFVYEADPGVNAVQVGSRQFGFFEETPTMIQGKLYYPEAWRPGLYSGGQAYIDMAETESGSHVWTATIPLPSGAYLYTYRTSTNDGANWGSTFTDPANPPRQNDKTGAKGANSILFMPYDPMKQAKAPGSDYDHDRSYVMPRTDGKKGTIEYLKLDGLSAEQDIDKGVAVYLPYGYDANRTEPYKTIYMAHGNNMNEMEWMNDGVVPEIMDNLIAEGKTESAIVVAVNNRAYYKFNRADGFYADQTDWDVVNHNLLQVVVPAIEEKYNVSKNPGDRAFGGESMGGQNAANIFLKHTGSFGYYAVLSGSYLLDPDWDLYDIDALNKPLVMSGAGLWDTNRFSPDPVRNPTDVDNSSRSNEAFEARMDKSGLYYVGPNCVPGAHAFETWHQIFATFVDDYLWTKRPDDIKIVKYDSQDAKFAANPTSMAVLAGAGNVGALPRDPVKDDYIFIGWNTKEDGTGTAFTAQTSVTTDITVYAQHVKEYSATQLQTLCNNNEFLLQNLYTDASWAKFQETLTSAKTVLDTENAAQIDISQAYEALQTAIGGLVKAPKLEDIMLDLKHPYTYTNPSTGETKAFEMPYRLYLPENYDPSRKYPMLIFLHGGGEGGSETRPVDNLRQIQANMQLVDRIIAEEEDNPCIILAPQADHTDGERWTTGVNWREGNYDLSQYPIGPSLSAVYDLVANYLPSQYSVDMSRLYCTGLSAGGLGAWSLMMYYPDLLAAGMPSNGTGDPEAAARLLVDMPIWIFHGGADTSIPVQASRDMYAALVAAGSTAVKYTEYPGVPHDGTWQRAYSEPDILTWMFAQTKLTITFGGGGSSSAPASFTVTFNSQGGSAVATQTVTSGRAATKPADPTR